MVFSAYSANNSKNKGDITWVGFYNESGKTTGGSADKVAWSATGVFKGSGAYTQSDSKAYISTSNTNRPYTYYTYRVKGISKVQSLVNPNGSSSIVTMNAFPITAGVPSEIADDSDASTTSNLDEVLEIDGLNTSTEYLITFESNNTSNIKILEIAFFYPEENQVYETIATLAERNYATYVTTNALDFSAASNIAAYIATGLNVGETAVVIEAVDEVPANEPILVKTASKGASVNVPVATSTVDALGSNLFVKGDGTTSVTESDGYYYLASDLFHLANTGTLQTGKAYLHITAPGARQLSIGFGDDSEPTGIQTICNEEKGVLNGEFYNIAGQRVALPQKGLYIVNGHKVVVK